MRGRETPRPTGAELRILRVLWDQGRATVREVAAGQAVFIPAGTPHAYVNEGEEPVEFLCIMPKTSGYATEWLEG